MKYLANPNYIYIGAFTVPLLVYSFGWSTIYPALTFDLLLFFVITFCFCILFGVMLSRVKKFNFNYIPVSRYNRRVIIALYFFYMLDILYAGFIPLLAFGSGKADYTGSINYGIPTLHFLVVTFNLFYSIYVFHQYLSSRKKAVLFCYFLLIAPFVILLQRSNIMYIIIGSMFVFFLSLKKLSVKKVLGLISVGMFAIYIFGYLGNLRSAGGDSTFIPRASGVTDQFLNGPIPNEFYWGYLYIGSPLANLQNNINTHPKVNDDWSSFIVYECMPDFLTKKLEGLVSLKYRPFDQINSFLNVGTIYARPYGYLSWKGIYFLFFMLMFLMNIYFLWVNRSSTYKVTGVAMMFIVIAFSSFENTITFSAYSFQLMYPLLFSMLKKYRSQPKKKTAPLYQRHTIYFDITSFQQNGKEVKVKY